MADILFVAVVVAFFALAAAFVVACDRIIGPDPLPDPDAPVDALTDDEAFEGVTR